MDKELPTGELSTVNRNKIDRMMKHMFRQQKKLNKKVSEKEQRKLERVGRGYDKIFALINRGIENVSTTK